jgi:hypothetical protein
MSIGRFVIGLVCAAGAPALAAQSSGAGRDTLEAPGPQYQAGALHRFLLGREYRSLWTTPITVTVLDLGKFAGGLRPVSKGGGQQTKSLLLVAPDGREFFFRSVDKDPSAILPAELRPTVAGSVVRDQTSSAFPTAPLVVDRLLTAARIPHATSLLVVLPNDRRLGEFQADFGGLMGFLEERIGGTAGPAAHWSEAREIISSDSLFARTERSTDDRVDTQTLLRARLFDLLTGDWDRHAGQWRWARFSDTTPRLWVPIPQDRDQVFAKYDGLLLSVARQSAPQLTNFGPGYPYIPGATWNGRDLDRRFLVGLEWPAWKAAADSLRAMLSDRMIDSAVRALPPEHFALRGAQLSAALRTRRDDLEDAARRYYRMLAEEVDVRGTNGNDVARLTRDREGEFELTIANDPEPKSRPYYRRRFSSSNTKEVRLYLGPGDDRAIVQSSGRAGGGPRVRIVGGGGQDHLVDSSRAGDDRFYDDPGGPRRTSGLESSIDRRPFSSDTGGALQQRGWGHTGGALHYRDWGHRWVTTAWVSYGPDIGLFIGAGRMLTTYGFRKVPYSSRHRFRAGFASGPKTYRVDYRGEFQRENSRNHTEVLLRASGVDVITFHGFGNEIAAPGENEFYRVTQDAFGLQPLLVFGLGERTAVEIGPFLKYASTDNRPDRFLATLGDLYGTGNFGEIGGTITLRHDSRDHPTAATKGLFFEFGGSVVPPLWDVDSVYGAVHGEARTYLSVAAPLQPTLALRAGGKKLWGRYPFFDAAFIGGASTVRLARLNRYAGDASAYGSAELRLSLLRFEVIVPTQLGVFGLADAGRVFLEGESSDEWHTAFGGGLSLSYLERAFTFSAAIASGEERTGVYLQAGLGF